MGIKGRPLAASGPISVLPIEVFRRKTIEQGPVGIRIEAHDGLDG